MARPSVIPGIKARLEAWLDEREAAYLSQPEATRQPTLPMTPDGKVNVRALAQAIDLKQTQEKYLFEREELTALINCIAEGQGVRYPLGFALGIDGIAELALQPVQKDWSLIALDDTMLS